MIQRAEIKELIERLKEPRKFIQVIVGPRQIGKTTQAFVVGNEGIPLADFLQTDMRLLFR